ncbi:MAG: histidinol-phosphate transaminase [Gemmatimonadota bacterium]
MSSSRRSFLASVGAAGAASLAGAQAAQALPWFADRGREAAQDTAHLTSRAAAGLILLNSNENPYGPAAEAINAVMQVFGSANRYPDTPEDELRAAIATYHRVRVESVLIGCGSTEILAIVTDAFTSTTRRLMTVAPTFETPRDVAVRKGVATEVIEVDGGLSIDLQAMYERCRDAGLLFICNPNNPTGTLHGIDDLLHFIARVNERSPEAHILVDEAYFDYVADPVYDSAIPEAVKNPRVIVSRTFSKVYGMAGLRVGYAIAHPETVRRLDPYRTPSGVNLFAATAAVASLSLPQHLVFQKARNTEVRTFAMHAMREMGYAVVASQANFFLTDIRRDPATFQQAMRVRGIAVGRPFPPLRTHTRISIGTMDEMQQAMAIAADVLGRA